jgi:hypothetical protein
MSDSRVHDMIAEACLGAVSDAELGEGLSAFLSARSIPAEDAAVIAAAKGRLALYRRLVRGTLADVVQRMMPRARARLNRAANGAFDRTFDAFLAEAAPRTHYLRDVPREFLAWAEPSWRANADVPAYIPDLAAHELAAFTVAAAPGEIPASGAAAEPEPKGRALGEVALDRPLIFAEAKQLARYAYAVHELPASLEDDAAPVERSTVLLIYRDGDHRVRYLDLTPLAADIVAELFAGRPLGDAVRAACERGGTAPTDALLLDTAGLLADLGARGVLLGARA